MNTQQKQSIGFVIFGIVLWFGNNIYHGWNLEAQSILERVLDYTVIFSLIMGAVWRPVSQETTNYKIDHALIVRNKTYGEDIKCIKEMVSEEKTTLDSSKEGDK